MALGKDTSFSLTELKSKSLSLCPQKENTDENQQGTLAGPKLAAVMSYLNSPMQQNTKKRKVLDEETYTDALEKIIQRDFYPDFEKLKAQNEYLEALESNDVAKLREIQIKYCSRRNTSRPGTSFSSIFNTPSTFETPQKDNKSSTSPKCNPEENEAQPIKAMEDQKSEPAELLTLDQFLYKFTSDDNASFDTIMVEAAKKHEQKYPWLYHDETSEADKLKSALALPSTSQLAIEDNKPKELTTWAYKNENALMYVPKGVDLTFEEKLEKEQRREVVHSNTRFKMQPFNELVNKAALAEAASVQAKNLEGKIGIDGKELIPKDTPMVNGYGFVASTPSPAPGVLDSPLMTWGEIEGTPFRLDGSDTPIPRTPGGPQFRIPDVPSRERLAIALADKASKQKKTKKEEALQKVKSSFFTPSPQFGGTTPRSPLDRLNRMSPAAQRLACAKLGIHRSTDKALLASYSPSPSRTPLRDRTPTGSPATPKTPILTREVVTDPSSLTDDLLNLSDLAANRSKAADFF